MEKRHVVIALVLLAGVGAWFWLTAEDEDPWAFAIHVPYTDADNPFSEDRLRERLERIGPLVEEVVGEPVQLDGLRLVLADGLFMSEQDLRASHPHLMDPAHEEYAVVPLVVTQLNLQAFWASLLGRYDPQAKTIELYPFQFEALKPDDMGALLDVVLAHELAHVWQDQRYGAFEHEGVSDTTERGLARAAVIEGSAEYVSREVAERIGALSSFERVAAKRDEATEQTGTPSQRALVRWRRWAYGEGPRFIDAVVDRLGPERPWDRLFEDMPANVWSIEHPARWIASPDAVVVDLDPWADRLRWLLEAAPARFDFQRKWGHRPILRKDMEERLALAGPTLDQATWETCRGGVLFAGSPRRGPLAGTAFVVRAWRFPNHAEAVEARHSLESAFDAVGPRVWAGDDCEHAAGEPRVIGGSGGVVVRASLFFDDAATYAQEGAWGLVVHESILVEAFCVRDGAAPVLVDLLDAATTAWGEAGAIDVARAGASSAADPYGRLALLRREEDVRPAALDAAAPAPLRDELLARHMATPEGRSAVVAWLRRTNDATAWMVVLGPAAGEEDAEEIERGPVLAAALSSQNADLLRFALGAVAEGRVHLPPWGSSVLDRIVALARHEDAWVRSAAVRAAETLADQNPLSDALIQELAADTSPAVRASLAASRALLKDRRATLRELARDSDPSVKRAADAEETDSRDGGSRLIDHIMEIALRGDDEKPAVQDDGPVDQSAAFEAVFEAMMTEAMGKDQEGLTRRIRKFLVEGDDNVRVRALQALQFMGERRAQFLPELIRAFDAPFPRHVAVQALVKGGMDLTRARSHLLAMLDHPLWRADVLRVIAANDLELPAEIRGRVASWMESSDLRLRTASALVLLRLLPSNERPLAVLDEVWGRLPSEWRLQVLSAAIAHRGRSEVTKRMRLGALYSPFMVERNAVFNANEDGVLDEAYLAALLDGMERVGPEVADEYWSHFLYAAEDLEGDDKARARDMLTARLDRWRAGGALPSIDGDSLVSVTWPELDAAESYIAALDRCLLRKDPSLLRYSLALLRTVLEAPTSPEVDAALQRVLSLRNAPKEFPPLAADAIFGALLGLDRIGSNAVEAALLWTARTQEDHSGIDIEDLLGDHPERIETAMALVPKLLDMGTRASVETAIEVLEVAGPRAKGLLPRLRERVASALPTWRDRLSEVIATVEDTDEGDG